MVLQRLPNLHSQSQMSQIVGSSSLLDIFLLPFIRFRTEIEFKFFHQQKDINNKISTNSIATKISMKQLTNKNSNKQHTITSKLRKNRNESR